MNPLEGHLVVSLHDVAATSADATASWRADLVARGVPATLLAIAGPWRGHYLARSHDLAMWLRAREERGDEVALHDWSHEAGSTGPRWRLAMARLIARGAAEFAALDEAEAHQRLARGIDALADCGLHAVGFTPPGWLASPGSRAACTALGFRYSTSQTAVIDHRSQVQHRIPAFCHRPGTRWEGVGAALLRRATAHRARRGRTVRIALHPADLERPGLREVALAAIDDALDAGLRPITYRDLLEVEAVA
ncbi:MAG TPA: DUF2334 domain-containing protein [Acidimicrobiales bacterium]|nr:DUF2334 domain-containing protein [Acidimicrobiales bacterium]